MNSNAKVIGLDIAKSVFVAVGMDERGKVVFKKKLSRDEVLAFFANLPPAEVGIEACAGAHYWARELNKLGHDARLIAASMSSPLCAAARTTPTTRKPSRKCVRAPRPSMCRSTPKRSRICRCCIGRARG